MRLRDIVIKDVPPVSLFAVDGLTDVVVLAGPNGVGKTRLLERLIAALRSAAPVPDIAGTIEATRQDERGSWGGKPTLDLSSTEDMRLFQTTLQVNRRRRNWRSSLVHIESDRTIQKLQPLAWTWDMVDPEEEDISWDFTIGFMRDRFQDTVHSMFRMIEAQRQGIANRAIELQRSGHEEMKLTFTDPMAPFKDVFSSLVAPKELADPSARQQRLEYRLNGQTFDFSTLSSGEREVVNIAFDFLLRKPQDCIVFFDEPELHLHPELSYRLMQTLQQIGTNNQFILSTHSPDVISASLDRSVVFISPPSTDSVTGGPANQAILVNEADETHQALKLLGQSIGIIALGKRIVLIEGRHSSLDKQTYGSIIGNRWPGLVLVPSGGKHVIESFGAVYDAVLSKSIWGVEFFMLCDKDSAPAGSPEKAAAAQQGGRLRILPRYHLENYFLDEWVWADTFSSMEPSDSWLRDPQQVRNVLREAARSLVSYAVSLAASSHLRLSIGDIDVMPKDCHAKSLDELQSLIVGAAANETMRVEAALNATAVEGWVADYYQRLVGSVSDDTEEWKALIPGKPLLGTFCARAGLAPARAKTLYLHAGLQSEHHPFDDIIEIFRGFASVG